MKLPYSQTLKTIADLIHCKFIGNPDFLITGINEIHKVEAGDLVFVDNEKYYEKALNSNATIILIDKEVDCPEGKALIISDNPFADFNKLTQHFNPTKKWSNENQSIDSSSTVFPNATIGDNVMIGKNCMIGGQVGIGGHISIADGIKVAGQSGIGHTVKNENEVLQGSPAINTLDFKRSFIVFKGLPELRKKVRELENKLTK